LIAFHTKRTLLWRCNVAGNNKMPDFNKIWNALAVGEELVHAE
jgi:hypothetical protein